MSPTDLQRLLCQAALLSQAACHIGRVLHGGLAGESISLCRCALLLRFEISRDTYRYTECLDVNNFDRVAPGRWNTLTHLAPRLDKGALPCVIRECNGLEANL